MQAGSQPRSMKTSPERREPSASQAAPAVGKDGIEADQRILKQKKQFENLLKQYKMDLKLQENKRQQDLKRAEKIQMRDEKIRRIKQERFEEDLMNQRRSQIFKRSAQQAKLCK